MAGRQAPQHPQGQGIPGHGTLRVPPRPQAVELPWIGTGQERAGHGRAAGRPVRMKQRTRKNQCHKYRTTNRPTANATIAGPSTTTINLRKSTISSSEWKPGAWCRRDNAQIQAAEPCATPSSSCPETNPASAQAAHGNPGKSPGQRDDRRNRIPRHPELKPVPAGRQGEDSHCHFQIVEGFHPPSRP